MLCSGAMFFRLKPSGPRTYLQIVENRREDGAHRQHVLATLGRADELAASGTLPALLASGARLCDRVMLLSALERDAEGLRLSTRRIGGPLLFELAVTKTWLRQVIVALPLICRGSYRGVMPNFDSEARPHEVGGLISFSFSPPEPVRR